MSKSRSFNVHYDAGSDVLYITTSRDPSANGFEDERGIVWRYASDGSLIGATVMDFYDIWSGDEGALASAISEKFKIPEPQALVVVDRGLALHDTE